VVVRSRKGADTIEKLIASLVLAGLYVFTFKAGIDGFKTSFDASEQAGERCAGFLLGVFWCAQPIAFLWVLLFL
jgi:hypothetical protein